MAHSDALSPFPRSVFGPRGPKSAHPPTLRARTDQSVPEKVGVGERIRHVWVQCVLHEAEAADYGKSLQALHRVEGVCYG